MSLQVKGQEKLLRGFRERWSILTASLMLQRRGFPYRSPPDPSLPPFFYSEHRYTAVTSGPLKQTRSTQRSDHSAGKETLL